MKLRYTNNKKNGKQASESASSLLGGQWKTDSRLKSSGEQAAFPRHGYNHNHNNKDINDGIVAVREQSPKVFI